MLTIALSFLLSVSTPARPQLAGAPPSGEAVELFNGKDLSGWEHFLVDANASMEDVWSVEDGVLTCKGDPGGYLCTKQEYESYRLVVEWRWPEKPGNSGVLLRIAGEPQMLPQCAEAQLKHGSVGDMYGFHGFRIGGDPERLSEFDLPGFRMGRIQDNEKPAGEWNRYEITVAGAEITVILNGKKVNEATGCDVRPGKIGLQSEGGVIHFRTVQLTALAPSPSTESPSWPEFHGPARDNISPETGLLQTWPEGGPPLLWTVDGLGHGFSSVSIGGGIICTTGNFEEDTVVTALDLEGNLQWQTRNGKAWTKSYPGTRSTPTIDGTRVYHQSPVGNIICLNAETGEPIWELDLLTEVNSRNSHWALAESLLVVGDRVISSPGGPETCMVALDKHTGKILWQAPSVNELAGYSSPILVEFQGRRIVVTLTAKAIIGVDIENGELLWHVEHVSYADENVLLPIHHDGHLFVSSISAGSVKWRIVERDGKIGLEEVWRTKDLDNHHGGVVLFDGNLYGTTMSTERNKWICLDWETGQKRYAADGVGKGSLTCADGMFYALSIDRLLGLVQPTPTEFEVKSSFEIPEGGKGPSWAHPVVCGGRLYIRHGEFLYVYDVKAGQ